MPTKTTAVPDAPNSGPVSYSLSELAVAVNEWCAAADLIPANGQVGTTLNERNLRFYRTVGVLDAPVSGGGRGYTEKHLLQLTGLRLLQAQGLPLRRIRELLFGRSLVELRELRQRGVAESKKAPRAPSTAPGWTPGEAWRIVPLSPDLALMQKSPLTLSPEQIRQIRAILAPT